VFAILSASASALNEAPAVRSLAADRSWRISGRCGRSVGKEGRLAADEVREVRRRPPRLALQRRNPIREFSGVLEKLLQ